MFSHRPQFPASHPRFLVRRRLLLFRIRLCRPQVLFLYRQFPVSHPQGRFFRRRFPVSRRQAGFHRRQSSALLRQADFLHRRSSALLLLTGFRRRRSTVSLLQFDFLHCLSFVLRPPTGFLRRQLSFFLPQAEPRPTESSADMMQSAARHPRSALWRLQAVLRPLPVCCGLPRSVLLLLRSALSLH